MPGKITGLNMTMLVEDALGYLRDISRDVRNFSFDSPVNLIDVTGIDKSVMERLKGLGDISLTLNGTFNPSLSHGVLKSVPSSDESRKVVIIFKESDTSPAPKGGTNNAGKVASTDGEFATPANNANVKLVITEGNEIVVFDVFFNSYNVSRGDDGAMTWTTGGESSDGFPINWTNLNVADLANAASNFGTTVTAAVIKNKLNGEAKVAS